MLHPSRLFALAATAALAAQTPPCASLNDANTNVTAAITAFATAGPANLAYQYTPAQTLIAQSMQVYTGNTYFLHSMQLEVWSDDPATSLPQARIAGGTWRITTTTPRFWQGTNFDRPVVMQANTPYWLVWNEPGWSQVPWEPGGATLPSARRPFGGVWAAGAATAFKFRLFCSLLDAQGVAVRGTACSNPVGIGTAFTNQAPVIGNADFMFEGTGYPAGATAALILGIVPAFPTLPLPGGAPNCFLHNDPFLIFASSTGTGGVRTGTAAGHVAFPLPIPADASLAGLFLGGQVAVLDTTSSHALPFVTSNGLRVTLY